ncbi:Tellurium resistance protein [Pseudomonas savastanoi]|uniref:Tellurium resistance protein n=1 Tax=Pseudomonas savastanoi TaxID=29438 RepID=A0A3M6A505_PSESS|nr:Tellurium resistance protein [Pseudomonas savastanoi]
MQITQGQRVPLSGLIQGSDLTLSIAIKSAQVIDYVCFGVDANGKLSDDRYMVFFNQPSSPCNSVKQVNGGDFQLSLAGLPASIERLVFTASIDGAGTMSEIQASHFSIQSQGREVARGEFSGATFTAEKAIMVADIYRKNGEWRIASNLQGYNAGQLKGHVYPDAVDALKHWHQQGYRLYVYSSGSIQAQQLIFGCSEAGDLSGLFSGYFDTTSGPKREAQSYRTIAQAIECPAENILFLSDIVEELDAAQAAGMITCGLARDGGVLAGHRYVSSFALIDPASF